MKKFVIKANFFLSKKLFFLNNLRLVVSIPESEKVDLYWKTKSLFTSFLLQGSSNNNLKTYLIIYLITLFSFKISANAINH